MQRSPTRDFIVGLFVLAGLGAIAYLSISVGGLAYSGPGGLRLYALFDQTGGLKPRAPVVISGVKVGQVESITLDHKTTRARVLIDVDPSLRLSTDTTASIQTAGILGDRYVSLQLGRRGHVPQVGRRDHLHRVGGDPRAADRQAGARHRHRARAPDRRTAMSTRWRTLAPALAAAVLLGGCTGALARKNVRQEQASSYDPLQRVNRKVFWFNDKVDAYVLEPVARGWDKVAPDPVQRSVSNFFVNARSPIVIINDLLQGKVRDSGTDVGRFAVNTTVGVLGFLDPATRWGMERHNEDFGQTLGVWGILPGPYLVLPVLGPSNPRDGVGLLGDWAFSVWPFFVNQYILLGARVVDSVNTRAQLLEEIKNAKEASVDYYTFVRDAYFQRRSALVSDNAETPNDELYEIEDESGPAAAPVEPAPE